MSRVFAASIEIRAMMSPAFTVAPGSTAMIDSTGSE